MWQPIETAPKDGVFILVADFSEADPEEHDHGVAHWLYGYWSDGYSGADWRWKGAFAPTHWMPLPEPPK